MKVNDNHTPETITAIMEEFKNNYIADISVADLYVLVDSVTSKLSKYVEVNPVSSVANHIRYCDYQNAYQLYQEIDRRLGHVAIETSNRYKVRKLKHREDAGYVPDGLFPPLAKEHILLLEGKFNILLVPTVSSTPTDGRFILAA